jgi:hypothetical protein
MDSATISLITSTALTIIEDIAPLVSNSGTIGKIIAALETYLPIIAKEATDLLQPIKNIITALSSNSAVTADQLAALQALDAQADAAFDAALANYNAQPTD